MPAQDIDEICVWSRSKPRELLFQGTRLAAVEWMKANYGNPAVNGPNWSIRVAGRDPDAIGD